MDSKEGRLALAHRIRVLIGFFIAGLVLSGVTAFPLEWELSIAHRWLLSFPRDQSFVQWINHVYDGIRSTYASYPFVAYGTDWLAFAHLIIAAAFIGPFRDPLKNRWVIEFGMIACIAVVPFALIAGPLRGIPVGWRVIDCSFGVVGGTLLFVCYSKIKKLEAISVDI
jgi:hypothetical protein